MYENVYKVALKNGVKRVILASSVHADNFIKWNESVIHSFSSLQKKLIDRTWQLLKPGGTLVYSTCTLEPEEDEEGNEIVVFNSIRAKALKFLNALEYSLHQKAVSKCLFDTKIFEQIFKVREFLRMPGSSTKSLMESVALVIPNFKN